MIKKIIFVNNATGLHARPASQLTELATQYESAILIEFGAIVADAKSIISLLSAGIKKGTEIVLKVDGSDEDKAMDDISALIEGFAE